MSVNVVYGFFDIYEYNHKIRIWEQNKADLRRAVLYTVSQKSSHLETFCNFVKS